MTTEKLLETLSFIVQLDVDLSIQTTLDTINASLGQLANAPAQPQQQVSLANALEALKAAADQLSTAITPAEALLIEQIGGKEFFDPAIAARVQASVTENAMTPSVAKTFVQDLVKRRSDFRAIVQQALTGMKGLGITPYKLSPGTADLAFVIPRELFDNELGSFAKELGFLSRLIRQFSEAVTGKSEPVELEGLSSSVPTVALMASLPVVAAIATIIDKFLSGWEKIEKIRKMRAELSDIGMDGLALDQLTDRITTTVNEIVEESTEITLVNYTGDKARRNELEAGIRQDTKRLFAQIERGLTVQFRAEPPAKSDVQGKKAFDTVDHASRTLTYPQVTLAPMLLPSGELIEGDIVTVKSSKKVTKSKTSVEEKAKKSVKEPAAE